MTQDHRPTRVAESRNGLSSPLYFDRQLVRADDLTLDRSSHAQELARMRQFLHGWGIVAGFEMDLESEQGTLQIAPGYGVSPLGREIYLTKRLEIKAIADHVRKGCSGVRTGCDEVNPEKIGIPVDAQAWIIARPEAWESDPRPGRPEGCGHPANGLSPARLCAGVSIDLVCALPESHHCQPADAEALWPYIASFKTCGPRDLTETLPLPEPINPEDDYVVLASILVHGEQPILDWRDRRVLLPTEVLQRWLTATAQPPSTPEPAPKPDPEPDPNPGPTPGLNPNLNPSVNPNINPNLNPNLNPNVNPNLQPGVYPNVQPKPGGNSPLPEAEVGTKTIRDKLKPSDLGDDKQQPKPGKFKPSDNA